MTNKQYEHIGRAVECVIRLNAMSDQMDAYREDLAMHLRAVIPDAKAANDFVTKNYGRNLASIFMPRDLLDRLADVFVRDAKREVLK